MSVRALACVAFALTAVPALAADRPNVLLICVDDLKPNLGCYGDPLAKTPNIDRLAARGVRFDRAYCNQAVCSPSRNALLVGLRPQTLGIYDLGTNFRKARPDAVTLPQYFKQNGWHVEGLGKTFHVGHGNTDDLASWSVPPWKANVVAYVLPESRAKKGKTREEALFANEPAADLPRGAPYESADVADDAYPDGAMASEAIRRIQAAKGRPDTPFFIAAGFVKPHLPFCAPKRYWDLYDRKLFKLAQPQVAPEGAPAFAPQYGGELRQYAGVPEKGPIDPELQRTLIHGYYAATSYMDGQVGRLLDALDASGLAGNTAIVLWGDHGWHLGDHGMWCKHTNYEQAARIPLIVVPPGTKQAGKTTGAFAESVDLYPTLCEIAGLPIPKGLDGASLVPVLNDPTAKTKDSIIHVYPRQQMIGRAIRTARHRLVEWKKPGAPNSDAVFELYDYDADPLETRNLAADRPEVVADLRAILAKHPEAKPQIKAPANAAKPPVDRNALFDRRDKNADGKLTRDEFLTGQPDPEEAPKRFIRFDANDDGVLSREEFVGMGRIGGGGPP